MKRFKRLPGEPNIFRIPRRYGSAPPEECPLNGGEEVPFLDCLECDNYVDFDTHEYSHCGIKEEEEKRRRAKEKEEERQRQDKFEREIAERDAQMAEEDRTMREEMAAYRRNMEKNSEKWQKEYEKQEEENKKRKQERDEMSRQYLIDVHGQEMVDWLEESDEKMKGQKDEADDEDWEWLDWEDNSY